MKLKELLKLLWAMRRSGTKPTPFIMAHQEDEATSRELRDMAINFYVIIGLLLMIAYCIINALILAF